MTAPPRSTAPAASVDGTDATVLARYYREIQEATAHLPGPDGGDPRMFHPGFALPDLTSEVHAFLSASRVRVADLPGYGGHRLRLLDLTGNPQTRTTKTLPSLLIVARAVRHIQRTGERIMIITPSSANKATALRDAVLRAIEAGLVTARQLQISTIVPTTAVPKLWASELSDDPALRALNPMIVYSGGPPHSVKPLVAELVDVHAAQLFDRHGVRLWPTLSLDNYMAADMVRAFIERDLLPGATARVHAHAVSSAFGLLGHYQGHQRARATGADMAVPRYFLVQHLGAPDMVLSLHHGSPDSHHAPSYRYDRDTGIHRQDAVMHFPATTFDPHENLDATFYTRRPTTSPRMNAIIAEHGGGGIVVSLHECLLRYAQVRELVAEGGIELPADPRELREWSLVMAVTGVLNGIDRDVMPACDDILVHASGSYTRGDFVELPAGHRRDAARMSEVAHWIEQAAAG